MRRTFLLFKTNIIYTDTQTHTYIYTYIFMYDMIIVMPYGELKKWEATPVSRFLL